MKKDNKIIITALATAASAVVTVAAGIKAKQKYNEFKAGKRIETYTNVSDLIRSFDEANKLLSSADFQYNLPLIVEKLTTANLLEDLMPEVASDFFETDVYLEKIEEKIKFLEKDVEKNIIDDKKEILTFLRDYYGLINLLSVIHYALKLVDNAKERFPSLYNDMELKNADKNLDAAVSNLSYFSKRLENDIEDFKNSKNVGVPNGMCPSFSEKDINSVPFDAKKGDVVTMQSDISAEELAKAVAKKPSVKKRSTRLKPSSKQSSEDSKNDVPSSDTVK